MKSCIYFFGFLNNQIFLLEIVLKSFRIEIGFVMILKSRE